MEAIFANKAIQLPYGMFHPVELDSTGRPGDFNESECQVNLSICVHFAKYSLCRINLSVNILLHIGYIPHLGLKFEEETSKMLHLEHGFVLC